jgi:hypothetical protein
MGMAGDDDTARFRAMVLLQLAYLHTNVKHALRQLVPIKAA